MMQIDEIDNVNQQLIDDDDNAAIIDSDASDIDDEEASPLLSALDDLESRVVAALNDFKAHPGTVSSTTAASGNNGSSKQTIHQELASILRPVVEVSAHTGPSTARALASSYPQNYTVEMCVDEIYSRINSELILPIILESAQSDTIPAKRSASLALFHTLHSEWSKAGSYLDGSTTAPSLAGPYGPGIAPGSGHVSAPPFNPAEGQRRNQVKSARRAELLRRWVQSAIPNLTPGTFTNTTLDTSAAGRGVLSASAALKPCLRYMAERIGSADDAGALRLFLPVMRMIEGVLGRLFLERTRGGGAEASKNIDKKGQMEGDALRASCIKFLEIVVLCFSKKELPGAAGTREAARMKKDTNTNDFSLEDLPPGHPIITRESLEEIGDYAFSTLRGLVLLGGQAAIDPNLLLAAAASSSAGSNVVGGSNPFTPILDILKPAALAFLKFESDAEKAGVGGDKNAFELDRATIELDFGLSQKSYSLSINAVQMLATKRPVYFKESSVCLARRSIDPPGASDNDGLLLSKAAITGIRTHLRSSCLTLLRHFLSVTSGSSEILATALKQAGMETQADRALKASKQQLNLMKGGRAARNRAAVFYEWDTSADDSRAAKRQRDTDDAQAKVLAAKMARGLGSGIQLPTSMVDACELVLLNLDNLPPKRPPVGSSKKRKQPIDLEFVVDAVVSNGASLSMEENHWYVRDGGDGWTIEEGEVGEDGTPVLTFAMNSNVLEAGLKTVQGEKLKDTEKAFAEQSKLASSMAFSRVLLSSSNARSSAVADFGKQIAARLALTLDGVKPSIEIERSHEMAVEAVESSIKRNADLEEELAGALEFALENPLVSSSIAYDLIPNGSSTNNDGEGTNTESSTSALAMRILNEAYVCSFDEDKGKYEKCLDLFVSSVVNACDLSNQNPKDNERKRIANSAASSLPHQLGAAPFLTPSSLNLVSSLCDIDEVVKKFSTKTPSQTIAEAAAARTAKAAAEKRATAALLILRDVAFQRDALRGSAIDCAVAIASGRLPASAQIEDKALKLVMNVIFPKNEDCSDKVVASAAKELEFATRYAIENYDRIEKANEAGAKKKEKHGHSSKSLLAPQSDEEKQALDRVRKPVVLVMALAVRRPEIIKAIMENGCRDGADVLSKAIKTNMPKLARAAATKHGAAKIAIQVADMASEKEAPLLICFLDNLVTAADKSSPSQELIDACQEIQQGRLDADGKPDIRYIMPVVSGIKRVELLNKLPEFVKGNDEILKTSLHRMSERLGRYSMIFRDEPDPSENTLRGMSSCEQMVYLHQLDFHAIGIPQKRYLDVIRVCLEDDEVFNDRVVQAALDYISGKFLEGESLPLAYMRTIILTCSKHESLHSWICHVLLPRLVEGQVFSDKRQWEGWMRCAKMLENTGDQGISSLEAIQKLPEEQRKLYRAKYPKK